MSRALNSMVSTEYLVVESSLLSRSLAVSDRDHSLRCWLIGGVAI